MSESQIITSVTEDGELEQYIVHSACPEEQTSQDNRKLRLGEYISSQKKICNRISPKKNRIKSQQLIHSLQKTRQIRP